MPQRPASKQERENARVIMKRCQRDPAWFLSQVLGLNPWSKQAEVVEAYATQKRIAVKSANAVGKSFLCAGLALHNVIANPNTYVVTTGASWEGVEKALWGSIHRLYNRARFPLGGRILDTELKFGPQWGVFGVSTKQPANFAGFRTERGVTVFVDEASALSVDIMDAIEGLCAADGSRIILIGNPLAPEGPFYDLFATEAAGWSLHSISAFDSPNYITGRNLIPGLATRAWVDQMREKWGEGSPSWLARVEGEFPTSVSHQVVPLEWLKLAISSERPARVRGPKRMGVDVARFGDDETVFVTRDDVSTLEMETHRKLRTTEVAGAAIAFAKKHGVTAENIFVDEIGVGAGVVDSMHDAGWCINGVCSGAAANDRLSFYNMRAEMHWRVREAVDPKRGEFHILPQHAELAKQLTWAHYTFDSTGRIQVEPKEAVKKRTKRSPDKADALQLTFSDAVLGAA